jgi:hypothetical protein
MASGELPDFADLDVERQRGTLIENSHGSSVMDWSSPAKLMISGCWIGRSTAGASIGIELATGRQTVLTQQSWWGPEDADVVETDRLRDVESDIIYEIDGPVIVERDFDGLATHKTCQLKVVTG